ncbi:hypothetical protein SDE12394_09270 [Streptococcus dysgalactiae subsp. equisimilis ATCC 12394]|nr:hypothetical protein SDE12394_09270 [Streptococcus dysgalactiae subsp. equisimilis ATCC 12394]
MDLPQAVRYRPYEKWSQKDYEAIIKKNSPISLEKSVSR